MRDTRDHRFTQLEVKIGLFLFAALLACVVGIYIIGVQSDLFSQKIQLSFTVDNGSRCSFLRRTISKSNPVVSHPKGYWLHET